MSEKSTDTLLTELTVKMESIIDAIKELKGFVADGMRQANELTINLVRLEDRLTNHEKLHSKLSDSHSDHEDRLQRLENSQPIARQTQQWVFSAVWAVVGAAAVVLAKKAGLL